MTIKNYLSLGIKLILILTIISSIYNELWHIASTNIFLLIIVFAPELLKKQYKINFPKDFEIFLGIFIIITLFVGNLNSKLAPFLFGMGTGLISLLVMYILYTCNQIKKNMLLISLFPIGFALTFGTILELLKYYIKIILNHSTENIYIFTMTNLSYVFLGGLIASTLGIIYLKTRFSIFHKLITNFKNINKNVFPKKITNEEITNLIKKGENEKAEFKSTLRINLHTNLPDKSIEYANLKTITGFLNSKGGTLLIGVNDDGKITGIKKDNFPNQDKFLLHFTNILKQNIEKKFHPLITQEIIELNEKEILKIEIKSSKNPVFLKKDKTEEFFIRFGPQTIKLNGSELIDYVNKHFKN